MPGAFPQSEELWGSWEERERRFWSVIHDDNARAIGTLITRFFHDHTAFRTPFMPQVYAIPQIELASIKEVITQLKPEEWGAMIWGTRNMRDVNWVQVTRASFFVLAIIFSVSVALQVLIAGTALFVNSGGWAAHASFARYFACIPSSWPSWHGWQDCPDECCGRAWDYSAW